MITFLTQFIVLTQVFAQDPRLPTSEDGRYTFSDVIALNGFSEFQLFRNAEKYCEDRFGKKNIFKADEAQGVIEAEYDFYVYKKGSLGKYVDGTIECKVSIEVKEGKYRYIITDFYFQEYERNRYGKFVPTKGKGRALETPSSKLNAGQWEAHKKKTLERIEALIPELQLNMQFIPSEKKEQKKTKIEENW